ncbi:MAG: FtsX-like permease family protein [Mucilaginibacter sp.]|nr:FtsX-like permease family protein [Mucilaginibacter sp.]
MNFASFIAGRITFRSKRTFSKLIVRIAIIGIMLGLGVMILSLAVVKGFKNEIREKIRGFDGDIKVIKYDLNSSYENSAFIKADTFERKAHNNHLIAHIVPFATKPGIIKANNEIEGVVLKGVDKNYDWSFLKDNLVAGSVINFADTAASKRQLMISRTTANRLKLKLGDALLMYFVQEPLRRRPFKVVGIFETSIEDIDKTYVVGDLALIKRLNNWKPDEIGGYEVRVANFDQLDMAAAYVNDNLPTRLKLTTVLENYPTIFEWLSLLDVNAQVMLVLMLMVAVINMISALLIMILERTSMIGMLKAMGASNWSIQKVFLYNATYLIGLGLLFGNLFGLGLSWFQYKTHFFKLDSASYYMTFIPIQISLADVVLLNIGTMIICLLVLVIPSMLVSKISPVKAIRFK